VVLKVPADTSKSHETGNFKTPQDFGIADTRKQQELRCVDGSAAQENFTAGARLAPNAFLSIFDSDGTVAFKNHTGRMCMTLHSQVLPRQGRPQISRSRAPSPSAKDGQLIGAEALLCVAVEVLRAAIACLRAGFDKGSEQRIGGAAIGHAQRTVAAMEIVCAIFVAFGTLEVRKDRLP